MCMLTGHIVIIMYQLLLQNNTFLREEHLRKEVRCSHT